MGNLLCVRVHRANVHDTKGGIETMQKAIFHYPSIQGCRADQGYRGTFKETLENFYDIKVDISEQIKGKFEVHPLRWKVERTFAWFNFSRRLSKDYEISSFYQEQICIISNLQTLLRRF
jgi:transposase